MYQLSRQALEALHKAQAEGICEDTEQQIIEIVLDQEIVSYATEKGSVSFDVYDLVTEQQVFDNE